jgi:bifunctional non-homologous end joining protein LigD
MGEMPRLITPMMASLRRGLPNDDDRYGWEFKWDGVRAIAYVTGGQVRLLSRAGRDVTGSYPELAVLAQRVDAPVILDGEIIAIAAGRPDFGLLQSRMHVRHPPASLVRQAPVQLYLFDLLHHGGQSLLPLPYTERRGRLAELGLDADPVRTTPWYPGGAADVLATSLAHALEGVVGKPLASAYHPGQRRDWIKVKNIRHQVVIICGWKPGQGRRADTIGSLLVGVRDGPRLRYAGHVGTGFTQAALADLTHRLQPLRRADSPFATAVPAPHARGAQWVQPRLVGEVAFTEWTTDQVLRHPSWRGLRTDQNPSQVHQESGGLSAAKNPPPAGRAAGSPFQALKSATVGKTSRDWSSPVTRIVSCAWGSGATTRNILLAAAARRWMLVSTSRA